MFPFPAAVSSQTLNERSIWKMLASFSDMFSIPGDQTDRYHILQADDDGVAPYTVPAGPDGDPRPYYPCDDTFVVNGFMSISGKPNGRGAYFPGIVEPTPELLEYIRTSMLPIAGDSITFQAVFRDDGNVLFLARNSSIIASRWLAILNPEDQDDGLQQFMSLLVCGPVIRAERLCIPLGNADE